MIDLEKRKKLMATAVLPLAFGIASCSLSWDDEEDVNGVVEENAQETVQENVQLQKGNGVVVEVNETVSTGYVTSYPGVADRYSYNAPLGGGKFTEQVPYNAFNERYGKAGEDLAATVPAAEGADIIVAEPNPAFSCVEEQFEILTDDSKSPAKSAVADDSLGAGNGIKGEDNNGAGADKGTDKGADNANGDVGGNANNGPVTDTITAAGATVFANLRGAEEGRIEDFEPVEDWLAPEGASLRALLMEWSDRSGWKVVWKSDREYVLEAGAVFRGRYMDVTSALVRTFARARPAPIATFYKGNMVLLITTLEDENAD